MNKFSLIFISFLFNVIRMFIFLTQSGEDNIEDNLEENQESSLDSKTADNIVDVDVLGLMFIFFFLVILLLQFAGMILHRWGTFLHLVSVTQLKNPFVKVGAHARLHEYYKTHLYTRTHFKQGLRDMLVTNLTESTCFRSI